MNKHRWLVKRMGDTRREREGKIVRTFGPLLKLCSDMREGYVDSIAGECVVQAWNEYMPLAETLIEVANCLSRIAPEVDFEPMRKIGKRLHHGMPLTESDVDTLEACIRNGIAIYRRTPLAEIRNAIRTEMIAIELSALEAA